MAKSPIQLSLDARSQRLYALGRADLESRFDPELKLVGNPFLPDRHMPHPSLHYALCLLLEGERQRAEEIILAALGLQERRGGDGHYGNFRWFYEDHSVIDLNAAQFVLEALISILLHDSERLSSSTQACVEEAMRMAFEEAKRLDVHYTYTNIYLLDVHNRVLGGDLLGERGLAESGLRRLREWANLTKATGAPHEFNSATYSAVQINALAHLVQHSRDREAKSLGLEMEQFIWRHVAKYWHPPTGQLGGPHSRAYRRDVAGAPGFLKVLLYKLLGDERLLAETPYYRGPGREGEVHVALTEYHCPPNVQRMFSDARTQEVRGVASVHPRTEATQFATSVLTLGTMSRPYGVGDPPEPWPQHNSCLLYYIRDRAPGYGVLYCRYRVDAGRAPTASDGGPTWLDIWDDGVFRTAQNGSRALVAYGLMPRGQRPVESLRLDIRMLGPDDGSEVLCEGERLRLPAELEQPRPIVIADGEVNIGLVPMAPTRLGHGPAVRIWRDGIELVVSVINYDDQAKVFWEYRSLSGPFFQGNVRNGFALWVSPRSEHEPPVFAEALAEAPLSDSTSGSKRRIRFGTGDEAVALEYDLRTMWP